MVDDTEELVDALRRAEWQQPGAVRAEASPGIAGGGQRVHRVPLNRAAASIPEVRLMCGIAGWIDWGARRLTRKRCGG